MRRAPQNPPEFIYKNLCLYSHMFKLQPPSKCSPCDAVLPSRLFSHYSEQFLNSLILMSVNASAIFCFSWSTSTKCFPLRAVFIQGNKQINKVTQGEIRWIGRVGHVGIMPVLVKNCWTQVFGPFFNWVVCLHGVELCEFFIYFGDQTLLQCIICKYIFPYGWFPFHFKNLWYIYTMEHYAAERKKELLPFVTA